MDFKNIFTETERKACYFLILTGFVGIFYGSFSSEIYSQSFDKNVETKITLQETLTTKLDSVSQNSRSDSVEIKSIQKPIVESKNLKKKFDTENNSSKLDLNSATIEDLIKLHGIGPKTATKIIELRNQKGSFGSVEELIEVKGIGKKKLAKIKDFVVVNPKN
ncbi:MAG: helix-hairpin-helix domain-containing protein [Calditrichaeota bacterium]|nr:MAG: helix-hairpin-helix domain-containing protein [Calditrichota bacterium]